MAHLVEKRLDGFAEALQFGPVEAVAGARPFDLAGHEPGGLERLQMLRDRRLRQRQLVDDLAANAGVARSQYLEDSQTSRMGDGLGPGRQLHFVCLERVVFCSSHGLIVLSYIYDVR